MHLHFKWKKKKASTIGKIKMQISNRNKCSCFFLSYRFLLLYTKKYRDIYFHVLMLRLWQPGLCRKDTLLCCRRDTIKCTTLGTSLMLACSICLCFCLLLLNFVLLILTKTCDKTIYERHSLEMKQGHVCTTWKKAWHWL